jgi:hypothetical protein
MSWLLVLPNETLASTLAERVDESDAILAVMNDRNERAQLSFRPRHRCPRHENIELSSRQAAAQ